MNRDKDKKSFVQKEFRLELKAKSLRETSYQLKDQDLNFWSDILPALLVIASHYDFEAQAVRAEIHDQDAFFKKLTGFGDKKWKSVKAWMKAEGYIDYRQVRNETGRFVAWEVVLKQTSFLQYVVTGIDPVIQWGKNDPSGDIQWVKNPPTGSTTIVEKKDVMYNKDNSNVDQDKVGIVGGKNQTNPEQFIPGKTKSVPPDTEPNQPPRPPAEDWPYTGKAPVKLLLHGSMDLAAYWFERLDWMHKDRKIWVHLVAEATRANASVDEFAQSLLQGWADSWGSDKKIQVDEHLSGVRQLITAHANNPQSWTTKIKAPPMDEIYLSASRIVSAMDERMDFPDLEAEENALVILLQKKDFHKIRSLAYMALAERLNGEFWSRMVTKGNPKFPDWEDSFESNLSVLTNRINVTLDSIATARLNGLKVYRFADQFLEDLTNVYEDQKCRKSVAVNWSVFESLITVKS